MIPFASLTETPTGKIFKAIDHEKLRVEGENNVHAAARDKIPPLKEVFEDSWENSETMAAYTRTMEMLRALEISDQGECHCLERAQYFLDNAGAILFTFYNSSEEKTGGDLSIKCGAGVCGSIHIIPVPPDTKVTLFPWVPHDSNNALLYEIQYSN